MRISKLTLGTAQLGLNYGIANLKGKPDFKTSLEILNYSWNNGINAFDTALAYGNSEEILGTFINSLAKEKLEDIVIISKLPRIEIKNKISFDVLYKYVKEKINQSLSNLNLNSIPIYLLHHAEDIYLKNGLVIECLKQIKEEGLIQKIGISIYNSKEAEASLNFKEIEVIQLPINIFNLKLFKTGILNKLNKRDFTIFARSIFLQGLFFLPPDQLPQDLKIAKKYLHIVHKISKDYQIEIADLAALFIRDIPGISSLVIGAESIDQVKNNVRILKKESISSEIRQIILEKFSNIPEKVVNPYLWNR
jgi:aryl-alcohol dehydrogenase-like predicted oxidoreductase